MRYVKLTATKEVLDAPKIKTALDAKAKELDAAKAVAATAEQTAKAKADIVAHLPTDASDATRTSAVQAAQLAQAEAAIAAGQRDGLNSTVAGLKKLLETAQAAPDGSCGYTATLELLPAQGDRKQRFIARPRHNALRDDSTKLVVTPDGLLSSANVVAADRTGDIIVELAGAIGGFGAFGPVHALNGGGSAQSCDRWRKLITIFDPADSSAYPGVVSQLQAAGYPLFVARVDKAADQPKSGSESSWPSDVIFYRTPLAVEIRISECPQVNCAEGEAVPLEEALVSVPQAGPVSYIPQRSSAFVRTVNDVQFENGVIKSWSADRPSEVLEVVRLPVRIMTALISVPAQLFQLRINHDTQAKSLVDIQAAEMASSLKLRILQTCLAAAGDDSDAARACLAQ